MRPRNDRAAWTKFVLGDDAPKQSKYGNKKTDGYDSGKEASRAATLKLWEKIGAIFDLKEQVEFLLIPKQKGERACKYRADFTYIRDGKLVVEDVKGTKTAMYRLKRKLMLWVHGIRIEEV